MTKIASGNGFGNMMKTEGLVVWRVLVVCEGIPFKSQRTNDGCRTMG